MSSVQSFKFPPALFAVVFFALVAFSAVQQGSITGRVNPPQGANMAFAISGRDTMRSGISQGNFRFNGLKAGVYQVMLRGNAPYRDTVIKDVAVTDTNITDLGTIPLGM